MALMVVSGVYTGVQPRTAGRDARARVLEAESEKAIKFAMGRKRQRVEGKVLSPGRAMLRVQGRDKRGSSSSPQPSSSSSSSSSIITIMIITTITIVIIIIIIIITIITHHHHQRADSPPLPHLWPMLRLPSVHGDHLLRLRIREGQQ